MLFLIFGLFTANTHAQEMDTIEKIVFAKNVVVSHISYPIESLSIIEEINKNKKTQYLEKLSTESFVYSKEFKQLQFLLSNSEINTSSIFEKRVKEFFINQESSEERLQVVFEKINDYWIPVEINIKENGKLHSLLPINNKLFNLLLDHSADSYHFQEFTKYWKRYSGTSFKIIPTNFQNAIIEHVVFIKNSHYTSKKEVEKIISINFGYFRPKYTPKNGWLITNIREEEKNSIYDLRKSSSYIKPIYISDLNVSSKSNIKDNFPSHKIESTIPKLCNKMPLLIRQCPVEMLHRLYPMYSFIALDMCCENLSTECINDAVFLLE